MYYCPKKSLLSIDVGINADMVARYRFISRGNTFANYIGISTQVPRVVEIVSNNTHSSDRTVLIGERKFYVKKPIAKITKENVYVLQLLDYLKIVEKIFAYLDKWDVITK